MIVTDKQRAALKRIELCDNIATQIGNEYEKFSKELVDRVVLSAAVYKIIGALVDDMNELENKNLELKSKIEKYSYIAERSGCLLADYEELLKKLNNYA